MAQGENTVRDFCFVQVTVVIAVLLLLERASAHAKFILEFTDGRKMTVSNYKEIGQSIKVYTPNGSFAFRKEDIVRVVDTDQNQPQPKSIRDAEVAPRPMVVTPSALARQEETERMPPNLPRVVNAQDSLPSLHIDWGVTADLAMEGLYRGRFVIGLLIGLKALKVLLASSFR